MYVIKLRSIIAVLTVVLLFVTVGSVCVVRQADAPADDGIRVPVIMYHSILRFPAGGSKYIVSPDGFESDLKYLESNGYTTVFMQDLIDYVYEGKPLPEKPMVLTFDDGYYNNYVYIYPLLVKYNARAVVSIVGSYTDLYTQQRDPNANYAYLSWDDVRELSDSGFVEIQNHTYSFHSLEGSRKGCRKNRGESREKYSKVLADDLGLMQQKCLEHMGKVPTTFTYPFGIVSEESFDVIKDMGFKASLSCEEGINILDGNPERLYMMKRCIRTPGRSVEDILRK